MNAPVTEAALEALYQEVLDRVLNDDLLLPSMPDIALDVRAAISQDTTTCESLTEIISRDPALTAYLVKAAASPVYRRPVPPKTLADVIGLLGFSATSSLVMIHCTRNMVELNSNVAKELFGHTWERLVVKTSIASFLAQQLKYRPVEQVQLAMLLTEVGSLSVLSAMMQASETPSRDVYFHMCRQYSKQLGVAALTKWGIDEMIIDLLKDCGSWDKTWAEDISLLDIANLALYYTVRLTTEEPELPELETLAAYAKLPANLQACAKPNWLDVITENDEEIQNIISAFK